MQATLPTQEQPSPGTSAQTTLPAQEGPSPGTTAQTDRLSPRTNDQPQSQPLQQRATRPPETAESISQRIKARVQQKVKKFRKNRPKNPYRGPIVPERVWAQIRAPVIRSRADRQAVGNYRRIREQAICHHWVRRNGFCAKKKRAHALTNTQKFSALAVMSPASVSTPWRTDTVSMSSKRRGAQTTTVYYGPGLNPPL